MSNGGQQQVFGGGSGTEDEDFEAGQVQAQSQLQDVDALLDEIDDVLEIDAEAFVRGFVQKGGQ